MADTVAAAVRLARRTAAILRAALVILVWRGANAVVAHDGGAVVDGDRRLVVVQAADSVGLAEAHDVRRAAHRDAVVGRRIARRSAELHVLRDRRDIRLVARRCGVETAREGEQGDQRESSLHSLRLQAWASTDQAQVPPRFDARIVTRSIAVELHAMPPRGGCRGRHAGVCSSVAANAAAGRRNSQWRRTRLPAGMFG